MIKYVGFRTFLGRVCSDFILIKSERCCQPRVFSSEPRETIERNVGAESTEVLTGKPLSSLNNLKENKLILNESSDDVSDFAPYHAPSFNFAAYINKSPLLQQLVDLGVNLAVLEKKRWVVESILKLDFEVDVKRRLLFLKDVGIPSQEFGPIITKAPMILKEDPENLQVRINYLESKQFNLDQIQRIITNNPVWLTIPSLDIDYRLGFFQQNFSLSGDEVRFVATRMPKLITHSLEKVKLVKFSVNEEMGFNKENCKKLILARPKIFTIGRKSLVGRFDYVHNKMGIPHEQLVLQPDPLLNRLPRIKERHEFLEGLGKAQYNPSLPGYISLRALLQGNDAEFCATVAHTPVQTFNRFLKSR